MSDHPVKGYLRFPCMQ
uniref:Uncharacterized protein n=1 Tax=Arundo donax TaxID=35708 RepID=A0A0A9FJ64_ARUDO